MAISANSSNHPRLLTRNMFLLFVCSDLCIKAVLMDDIMGDPEHPDKDCVVNFETKSLRDARELLVR